MKRALCLALLLAGCWPVKPGPVFIDPPVIEQPTCAEACEHLNLMGCEEAAPTPDGATCEEVCGNAAASPAGLDVHCLVHAINCDAAARCE